MNVVMQTAVSEKSKLERMFAHYESIHKNIKAALDLNQNRDEALVTKIMDNILFHSNLV